MFLYVLKKGAALSSMKHIASWNHSMCDRGMEGGRGSGQCPDAAEGVWIPSWQASLEGPDPCVGWMTSKGIAQIKKMNHGGHLSLEKNCYMTTATSF